MPPAQRPHRSKQNYQTPDNFIAATRARLGITSFAFDFAADSSNTQARLFYNVFQDALAQNFWAMQCCGKGEWGWLNPPFTQIGPWAAKCAETRREGGNIAFLVPAAVGANWFRDFVDRQALVLLLNGRLAFIADQPKALYPKDCILALYSPHITPGYEVWTWKQPLARKKVGTERPPDAESLDLDLLQLRPTREE